MSEQQRQPGESWWREGVSGNTVKRVFGEPYEKDGMTIIPVAAVAGGAGGGSGPDPQGNAGAGGGFGVAARPVGVYVIQDGQVRWEPAFDLNRVILGGQLVVVIILLTLRSILKARARAATRP
ncbi:MAG TPA: spore germination protein GerW family protein [Chloroflexota bacterium]|nr:spore germination protein GerW family protein [Chloroflexota bacterium]